MRSFLGRATRAAVVASLVATGLFAAGTTASAPAGATPPAVGHVFTIVLENKTWEQVMGATGRAQMPYLDWLDSQGVLLNQMYATDHASLTNYVGLTSGQLSNASTQADCIAHYCPYASPDDANIGDQLDTAGKSWKGYMEDMGTPCKHPANVGDSDPYLVGYATRHNPFVYYDSIIDNQPYCDAHDVDLSELGTDITNSTVPNYSFIVPNTCNDAHDDYLTTCQLPAANTWLAAHVPAILASPEYQADGMLVITWDESAGSDTRGCCGGNAKGGRIHTLVLSPLIPAASRGRDSGVAYDQFSLLKTEEDIFGLPYLGHAADASTLSLGDDVFGARPSNDFAIATQTTPITMSGGDTRAATVTSTVKTPSATGLTLSVSASNASITPTVSPTTITSGGSATVFVKSTASATGDTVVTVKATNGAGVSHLIPLNVSVIGGPVNGSFEASSTIAPWGTAAANPAVVTTGGLIGPKAARTGLTTPKKGMSQLNQTFTVPATASTLTINYKLTCTAKDYAKVILRDLVAKVNNTVLPPTCTKTGLWSKVTYNVVPLRNKSVKLTMSSKDDGGVGTATYALWDESSVA
jgi:phosphatidylinositol-3-phosphatase